MLSIFFAISSIPSGVAGILQFFAYSNAYSVLGWSYFFLMGWQRGLRHSAIFLSSGWRRQGCWERVSGDLFEILYLA
jgi:hypothetical protein